MPIFDYECQNCGNIFEELVRSSSTPDSDIKCPKCGDNNSRKKLSAPAIGGSTHSTTSSVPAAGCGSGGFT